MAVKPDLMTHLDHLTAIFTHVNQLTDVAYIEDGIKYCRLLLSRGMLAVAAQSTLGILLYRAFQLTHKIEYLNGRFLPIGMVLMLLMDPATVFPSLSSLYHRYQSVLTCNMTKKTCTNSCNYFLL